MKVVKLFVEGCGRGLIGIFSNVRRLGSNLGIFLLFIYRVFIILMDRK